MTSKVRVDMSICSHETQIEAEAKPEGAVSVRIRSTCKDVMHFAELLGSVEREDYLELKGSKILKCAADVGLTPTCLIPAAVFNVVWMEVGMISKRTALKEKAICIHFEG